MRKMRGDERGEKGERGEGMKEGREKGGMARRREGGWRG